MKKSLPDRVLSLLPTLTYSTATFVPGTGGEVHILTVCGR